MELMCHLAAFGFQASYELTQLTARLRKVNLGLLELGTNHGPFALALKQPPVLGRHRRLR